MLTADHWIARTADADEVILSPQQIAELNLQTFATVASMVDLNTFPLALEAEQLHEKLRSVSFKPAGKRCFADGTLLSNVDYDGYESTLNLAAIRATNPVGFGLCVQRSNLRSYPTDDIVYKPDTPVRLDRFQESGLFPADAIAVLHRSVDAEWLLVQSYNYLAWIRANAVATADRAIVLNYQNRAGFTYPDHNNFIVVTADKLLVEVSREPGNATGLQLDMGTRLPFTSTLESDAGSGSVPAYVVDFPVRDEQGTLQLVPAHIAHSESIRCGYFPFTRRRIIEQAFRFLGENYGWGHADNARDCSGFVAEIYRTMGIQLPRNADDQGSCPAGENLLFEEGDALAPKLKALRSLQAGDLIFTPGHVMLYLGIADDEPWVIHDASALNFTTADGKYQSNVAGGVSVSPLLKLHLGVDRRQVEAITCLKLFR